MSGNCCRFEPGSLSRTKNLGQIAAIGGLSFIIAIAFGGILSDATISRHFSPSLPFWITATLAYINLICIILLFHETHIPSAHPSLNVFKGLHNILSAIKLSPFRPIYAVNFLFMLAWVDAMQFLPAFLLQQFSFQITGVTLTLMAVGAF